MPKRKLAVILFTSMSAVVAVQLVLMMVLAAAHKPYMAVIAGLCGTIPGFVMAIRAWHGQLPSACQKSSKRAENPRAFETLLPKSKFGDRSTCSQKAARSHLCFKSPPVKPDLTDLQSVKYRLSHGCGEHQAQRPSSVLRNW